MKPDRITLVIFVVFMLLILPAQMMFSRQIEERRLEVAEQRCIELIEMMERRGIDGFRWNGESCGKCYPKQAMQRECEI